MKTFRDKDSFQNIRHNVKVSFFVSSIIPLALLVYISLKYIYPHMEIPFYFIMLLSLTVIAAVLGLFLLTETTNSSIISLQRLYEKLNSLIKITKHLRATTYPDILLKDIITSAMRLNPAETCSLLLFDEGDNLRYKVAIGEKAKSLEDKIIKQGEGFSGWVASNGQPLLTNEAVKDVRYNPDFDKTAGITTRSALCVPLVHDKKVIGVIELLNKKEGVFTSEDEQLLSSLADQAAISITQSRLYENQKKDTIHMTEIFVNAQGSNIPQKRGHVRRVAKYANLIAKNMGFSETDLKTLYHACLLHDIGFLNMDTSDTEGKPWVKERFIQHPELGYEMIKPISLWSDAAPIILHHHERYDGKGYPSGKKGEEIPLGARILFVAEVLDVLTSKSSYKNQLNSELFQLNFEEALKEIEANAGSQFDPAVVNALKLTIKETDLIG